MREAPRAETERLRGVVLYAMRTDPTDNGGLFIGRRPGTRPIKYRALPQYARPWRQRVDRSLAGLLLAAMTFVCLLFWGPLPIAWMWVGSQVDYLTKSTFLGMVVAFLGLLGNLIVGLMVMRRLDLAWILARRAGGHDQRQGVIGPVFAVCSAVGAIVFFTWLMLFAGPTPQLAPTG